MNVAVLVDSWPVVSVDKTGRVVVPCCGACCTVDILCVWGRCVGEVCGCVTGVWDIFIKLRVETGEKHWRVAD